MSRVIAGSHGGRRIATPPGDRTRPTTDRVREALFSAVAAWAGTAALPADQALAGLAVLDLYAGSGAVGLEAASRGGGPVLLVEADKRTALVTVRNVRELGLPARVHVGRVETLVAEPAGQVFDVAFLDPPYALAADAVDAVVARLVAGGWLAPDALVVVERSRRGAAPVWPAAVGESWSRSYGETVLHFAALDPGPTPVDAPAPPGAADGPPAPRPEETP